MTTLPVCWAGGPRLGSGAYPAVDWISNALALTFHVETTIVETIARVILGQDPTL
jgi:hypothetical protein